MPRIAVVALAAWLALARSALAQDPAPLPQPDIDLFAAGQVEAIVRMPDGGVVVAGAFSTVFDPATQLNFQRDNLARFKASGALDLAWDPAADRIVYALAVASNGDVFAGGEFQSVDGILRSKLVRLSGTSGDVVAGWNAPVDGFVESLAIDEASGSLFVGGGFISVAGQPRANIAKVSLATGALDAAWNPGSNGRVEQMLRDGGSSLYVLGIFDVIGGGSSRNLARLAAGGTGAIDGNWLPNTDLNVKSMAFSPDGSTLYVGGSFTQLGGQTTARRLARVSTGATAVGDATWVPQPDGTVTAVAVDATGRVLAGGDFTTIGGQPRARVARLAATGGGAADPAWNPGANGTIEAITVDAAGVACVGGTFASAGGALALAWARLSDAGALLQTPFVQANGFVSALAAAPDGSLFVGGDFVRAGTVSRERLLKLAPDGTIDATWNPGANGIVQSLALSPGGALYAGGLFDEIGGVPRRFAARLDASGGGAVDAAWDAALQGGAVSSWAFDGAGSVFIGGAFIVADNQNRLRLAKVQDGGTGALDPDWNPGTDGWVRSILLANGALYVGGGFANVAGQPRARLAKIGLTGSGVLDSTWNPGATGSDVVALELDSGGGILVGGFFDTLGGQPRVFLGRVAATGSGAVDVAWNPQVDSLVWSLAATANGDVYVGGSFSAIDGQPRVGIAKLTASGVLDPAWNPGANLLVQAIAPAADGSRVDIGGYFSEVGGQFRRLVAALPTLPDTMFANGFE